MNDTDNRMQELALRRAAFSELLGCATDWQARCLAAEAERNALAAELKALKAWLPKWQRHGELWLLIAGTHRVWVEPVGDKWRPMHFGPETYSLEDAMVVAGGYLGLPPCEVEGE